MSKRERIILIFMAIAVIYGFYTYLYSSQSKTGVSRHGGSQDLNRFVIDIANKITDNRQSKNDEYLVAMASANWKNNPFLGPQAAVKTHIVPDLKTTEKQKEPEPLMQSEFLYTGYLNIGDSTMAIINGQEHKTGDALVHTGYYVKKIFPTWVEIGMQGKIDTIILPLERTGKYSMEKIFGDKADDESETR